MKKIKLYVIFSAGVFLIVLAAALAVRLIYHFPYIAVITGAFACAVMLLLAAKCLILRLVPCHAAEKRLEKLIQAGEEAHIAYFGNSEDGEEACPDFVFHTTIQQHDGLRTLEFSVIKPETITDRVTASCGAEMDVFFYRNGRQYIGFTGTLGILNDAEPYVFQIVIHTVSFSDRSQGFSVDV